MIKISIKSIDYSSDNTIKRDLTTLENDVNGFIRTSDIVPLGVDFQQYQVGTTNYIAVVLEFNIKKA